MLNLFRFDVFFQQNFTHIILFGHHTQLIIFIDYPQ